MNGKLHPKSHAWLGPVVVALLVAQLGMGWVQGRLLHRQHQDILGLREDIQSLVESLDEDTSGATEEDSSLAPARTVRRVRRAHRLVRVAHIAQEEPADPAEQAAKKDLEASRQSAQRAVKDAREVQQKLSIEENIRKADEKAKLERAQNAWQKWVWIGLGAGLAALVLRSWLRRRS
jgi:hypothetical protein